MEDSGYCSDTTLILSDVEHTSDREELGEGMVTTANDSAASARSRSPSHEAVNTTNTEHYRSNSDASASGLSPPGKNEAEMPTRLDDSVAYEGDPPSDSDASNQDFASDQWVIGDNDSYPQPDNYASNHDTARNDADDDANSERDDDEEVQEVLRGSDRSELGDPRPSRDPYTFIARLASEAEAMSARDMFDGFTYSYKHGFQSKKRTISDAFHRPAIETAQEAMAHGRHTFLKGSGVLSKSTAYVCRSHVGECKTTGQVVPCTHLMLLTEFMTVPHVWERAQKGEHESRETESPRFGVHPLYKQRVYDLVLQNYLPSAIHTKLLAECLEANCDLNLVPETNQILNVRSNKRRHLVYTMKHFNDIIIWIDPRLCTTVEEFYGPNNLLPEDSIHKLIILDWFNHEGALGFVFTSRAIFRNVKIAAESQPGVLVCSADGTYKIHFGGWVLVVCGTVGVIYDNKKGEYRHRFFPWAYMFVLSENEYTYTRFFQRSRSEHTSSFSWT